MEFKVRQSGPLRSSRAYTVQAYFAKSASRLASQSEPSLGAIAYFCFVVTPETGFIVMAKTYMVHDDVRLSPFRRYIDVGCIQIEAEKN
jgi:hypothetical protein